MHPYMQLLGLGISLFFQTSNLFFVCCGILLLALLVGLLHVLQLILCIRQLLFQRRSSRIYLHHSFLEGSDMCLRSIAEIEFVLQILLQFLIQLIDLCMSRPLLVQLSLHTPL